jgi:hypothetical protein
VLAVRPVTVTGDVPAEVPVTLPGELVAVRVVGIPPVVFNVTGTVAVVPETVAVPIVGTSGTSAIFVFPAEASLDFDPCVPELLGLVTAMMFNSFYLSFN